MAETERKPRDLLWFASSLIFFSITTALAVSAILRNEGIVTVHGAWEELVGLYRSVMHFVFGGLASLVPIEGFALDAYKRDLLGALSVMTLPLVLAVRSYWMKALWVAFLVFFFFNAGFGCGVFSARECVTYHESPTTLIRGFAFMLGVLAIFALWSRSFWLFARNLLGATLIILALMTTGFFEVTV